MLPLPLQFIIAMMAYAINERMARQLDYLLEEARVLREAYTEATGRKRVPFGCRILNTMAALGMPENHRVD